MSAGTRLWWFDLPGARSQKGMAGNVRYRDLRAMSTVQTPPNLGRRRPPGSAKRDESPSSSGAAEYLSPPSHQRTRAVCDRTRQIDVIQNGSARRRGDTVNVFTPAILLRASGRQSPRSRSRGLPPNVRRAGRLAPRSVRTTSPIRAAARATSQRAFAAPDRTSSATTMFMNAISVRPLDPESRSAVDVGVRCTCSPPVRRACALSPRARVACGASARFSRRSLSHARARLHRSRYLDAATLADRRTLNAAGITPHGRRHVAASTARQHAGIRRESLRQNPLADHEDGGAPRSHRIGPRGSPEDRATRVIATSRRSSANRYGSRCSRHANLRARRGGGEVSKRAVPAAPAQDVRDDRPIRPCWPIVVVLDDQTWSPSAAGRGQSLRREGEPRLADALPVRAIRCDERARVATRFAPRA